MNIKELPSLLVEHLKDPFYALLTIIYLLLVVVYAVTPPEDMFTISALIYPPIALVPFLLYLPSAKRVGFSWKDKFSVLVVFNALGSFFWLIAEIIWCYYYNLGLGIEEPYPSEADIFYISAAVFVVIGIAIYINNLYQDLKGEITTREITVSVLFTAILTAIVAVLFLYPLTTYAAEEELIVVCLDLTYIILDIVMAVLLFIGMLLIRGRIGKVLFLFLLSALLVVIFDVAFAYLDLIELYYDGHPIELLDIASYFIDAFAFYEIYKLYK